MKRVVFQASLWMIVFVLLLSGCTSAQSTATSPKGSTEATSSPAQNSQALSTTETVFAERIRPNRAQTTSTPKLGETTTANTAARTPAAGVGKVGTPSGSGTNPKTPTAAVRSTDKPMVTATLAIQPIIISTLGAIPVPEKRQALNIPAKGGVFSVVEYLNDGVPAAYQINAAANQVVYLAVYGRTNIQVYDPKLAPITNNLVMPGYLRLVLANNGVYTIVLSGLGNVTLSVYLPPADSNLASAAPVPAKPQAVQLPVRPLSVSFYNKLEPADPAAYTFSGQAGQTLTLLVTGNLTATLLMPDGNTADADIDMVEKLWTFKLPETGSYTLVFLGVGVVNVTAKITPPVRGTALAAPQTGSNTPILLPPDSPSISFSTYLVPEKAQSYVLYLPAKQALFVNLTGNAVVSKIVGPGNTPVVVNHAEITKRWSAEIIQEGDYVITIFGKGPSGLEFVLPMKGITP